MKQTQQIMGMPIIVEIPGDNDQNKIKKVFNYFRKIDQKFSTYKKNSEISQINKGEIKKNNFSPEMKLILDLADQTKMDTNGFFDSFNPIIKLIDPSGIVKGWAINEAAIKLKKLGVKNFYIAAGGDIQVSGRNSQNKSWKVGIKNPFSPLEIIKVIEVETEGVATSGTYERGTHIYNPISKQSANEIASLTVIAPNIYEADRFATAAFAMGEEGINFIEKLPMCEGYMIGYNKIATMTTGFARFVVQ